MLGPLVTCERRQQIVTWIYKSGASRKYWSADRVIVNIMQHFTWNVTKNMLGTRNISVLDHFFTQLRGKVQKEANKQKQPKFSLLSSQRRGSPSSGNSAADMRHTL